VVGLVGESGCGKSTLGRVVAGILEPSDGAVHFRGRDVAAMPGTERRAADLAIQMVFQDPMASLNPRRRVREILDG
jgi:peptide/nickel transport system ATP-binding protein